MFWMAFIFGAHTAQKHLYRWVDDTTLRGCFLNLLVFFRQPVDDSIYEYRKVRTYDPTADKCFCEFSCLLHQVVTVSSCQVLVLNLLFR